MDIDNEMFLIKMLWTLAVFPRVKKEWPIQPAASDQANHGSCSKFALLQGHCLLQRKCHTKATLQQRCKELPVNIMKSSMVDIDPVAI